jgi:hypothetical protein
VLQDIVASYNATFHSTIKTSPDRVSIENEKDIRRLIYGRNLKTDKGKIKNLYNVGDSVRASHLDDRFKKGYARGWSNEIFTISRRLTTRPVTYVVKDTTGEEIRGKFYHQELQKVKTPSVNVRSEEEIEKPLDEGLFKIEKIIRSKRVKGRVVHLVKWLGYSSKHNSWVDSLIDTKH